MKEKSFVQGLHYNIEMKDSSIHEGVFVFENKEFVFLKLGSGYNIGISKKNIESCKEESSRPSLKIESEKALIEQNPEIMILHTGGTIASKVDYSTGAVNAKFTPEEMIELFPELKSLGKIGSVLVSNMPSDDINFAHYNKMAEAIEKSLALKSIKGIILTHGTDTLHYTSSALSFIFEHLSVPVVLVGSQRSSDRPSSDAALNLLSAAYFISEAKTHNLNGVFICMHESNDDDYCTILNAHNVRKMHSSRRDAFKSINCGPVARINFEKKKIEVLKNENTNITAVNEGKTLRLFNPEVKVGILRSRPGLLFEELKFYEKFDGLILEGTGLGHFPIDQFDEYTSQNKDIFKEIEKISSKKIACMTSQTIFGRINLNVYSPGRMLKDAGVLGHNLDMTTETAYIKLVWLLSNYSLVESKELYSQNLRGEISSRSDKEEFL
ncbi:MAG: Glu-tRNA(Gln) amidotransferase subunit GatD [Candidatus Nanoarchaeia archaeon]